MAFRLPQVPPVPSRSRSDPSHQSKNRLGKKKTSTCLTDYNTLSKGFDIFLYINEFLHVTHCGRQGLNLGETLYPPTKGHDRLATGLARWSSGNKTLAMVVIALATQSSWVLNPTQVIFLWILFSQN